MPEKIILSNPMTVIAKFFKPMEAEPTKTTFVDWDSRQSVANFAKEANLWLRRGKGYTVVTNAQ